MSASARQAVFFAGVFIFAALLLWGLAGLPPAGAYHGPYGNLLNRVAGTERHVTDNVTAINFDYRGFDTLGEEFILFSSVMGVALLLRLQKGESEGEEEEQDDQRQPPPTSDAVRDMTLGLIGLTVIFGLYVVTHGQVTPGGGFQGGVILATAALIVYLGGEVGRFKRVAPHLLVEIGEATGGAGYAAIGFLGLFFARPFMTNVVPLGQLGSVLSGGTIALIDLTTGLEVAGGFVLLLQLFVEQTMKRRERRGKRS